MNRQLVESSHLKSVGYDPAKQVLEVEFHSGQTHQYHGVPAGTHKALMNSDSKGKFFRDAVRGTYKTSMVGGQQQIYG